MDTTYKFDIKNYGLKFIILYIFIIFVEKYPNMKKYSEETKFNVYRSLLCLFFVILSIENIINNFQNILNPFNIKNDRINDLFEWFLIYLIIDIVKMISMKNKRWDLYSHHILSVVIVLLSFNLNSITLFNNIILLNEIISLVTGIDSIYMEEDNLENSKNCKKYRKYIIQYIRLPIWLFGIYICLFNNNNMPSILYWLYLFSIIGILGLDQYWLKKCNKVINSYE
uniref:TLC domain-containing protein n=1 Tax=viral metagenome TaxID=1070528 RepID=A0A6C0EFE3_9ZZZZ